MAYTSEHLSLAALELLVHLGVEEEPPGLVAIWADVDEAAIGDIFQPVDLPGDWQRVTGHRGLREIGDDWQRGFKSPALAVPSVVVPEEQNILLNPEHPEFARYITIGEVRSFTFDRRLFVVGD